MKKIQLKRAEPLGNYQKIKPMNHGCRKEDIQTKGIIKGTQIKTRVRFHLTLVRMAIIKNTRTNVGEDVGKKEPLWE
jgi:hypothetical protein